MILFACLVRMCKSRYCKTGSKLPGSSFEIRAFRAKISKSSHFVENERNDVKFCRVSSSGLAAHEKITRGRVGAVVSTQESCAQPCLPGRARGVHGACPGCTDSPHTHSFCIVRLPRACPGCPNDWQCLRYQPPLRAWGKFEFLGLKRSKT